jgi:hypothetical protein
VLIDCWRKVSCSSPYFSTFARFWACDCVNPLLPPPLISGCPFVIAAWTTGADCTSPSSTIANSSSTDVALPLL